MTRGVMRTNSVLTRIQICTKKDIPKLEKTTNPTAGHANITLSEESGKENLSAIAYAAGHPTYVYKLRCQRENSESDVRSEI